MDDSILLDFAAASQDDLGLLLGVAARRVSGEVLTRLGAGGHPDIRAAHLSVFAGLEPGGTRITTLADRAQISRQAMSSLVRDVEAVGYVVTEPDPGDGRAVLVRLTSRGVRFCVDALATSQQVSSELAAHLGADRVEALRHTLRAVGSDS